MELAARPLMNRTLIPFILAVLAMTPSSGCALFRPVVVQTIDDDWTSPLDSDLQIAVDHSDAYFAEYNGKVQLRWAGVRGASYGIERGPTGEPIRKAVSLLYVFYMPAQNKCFLSPRASPPYDVRLAREHLGGGRYGEPEIMGMTPVNGDDPIGDEVLCSALATVKGGVHAHVRPGDSSSPPAVSTAPAPAAKPKAIADADPVTRLSLALPKPCADYVRAACSRPSLPSGTNRDHFCSELVDKMNTRGMQPGADKKCRALVRNQTR